LNLFKLKRAKPAEVILAVENDDSELEAAYLQIGELADALGRASADLAAERGRSDVEKVKAKLLEPYVNKVFNFVAVYCATVAIFIFMSALQHPGFKLPESILAIIAGSTAVSVIGLIGLVISGLFGGKKV
jgi:hypothetical protein